MDGPVLPFPGHGLCQAESLFKDFLALGLKPNAIGMRFSGHWNSGVTAALSIENGTMAI